MEPAVKRRFLLVLMSAGLLLAIGGMFAGMSAGAGSTVDPALVAGRWLTESGNLEIDIAPCGARLCGKVTKVVADRSMRDPRKAMVAADGRSPMGMTILSGFVLEDGAWKGRIYNRENGKTYDCLMTVSGVDTLRIRAYVGLPLLGKTQLWTRVPQPKAGAAT